MCRHLAYVGEPVLLGELIIDPPHSLLRQSWQPRRQHHGVMNADGFGVGWYVHGDPRPARHRGAGPIWADETLGDLARVVRSAAVLAAIRSATAGMAAGGMAASPFRAGRWLFSHNGALEGWPKAAAPLASRLPPDRLLTMDAPTDAALLWLLTLELLEAGAGLGQALAEVVTAAIQGPGGRLNLLVTDGSAIAATAAGASLSFRVRPGAVVVASEPDDDEPGWQDVADGHLLIATPDAVTVTPL